MELKDLGQTTVSALIHMDIRLEREHWTMFRTKLLGITAAATLGSAAMLGTTTANAAIDVDLPADEVVKVTYAKETLTEAGMIDVDGTKYHLVEAGTNNALDIRVRMDYAATGLESIYLRFDLSGMVFGAAVASTTLVDDDGDAIQGSTLNSGGAQGQMMAILSVGMEVAAGDEVRLRLPSVGIMMGASGSVTVGLYDTLRAASSGENSLKMRMANDVVTIASGLVETGTPYDEPYPTAEVSKEFKEFIEAGPHTDMKGTIGSYVVGWMAGVLARDGSPVDDLEDLVNVAESDVMIAGDFSVGTFNLDDMMDCTTASGDPAHAAVVVNEDKDMGTAELSDVEYTTQDMDGKYLCITVDGETEIPAGSYHASVKYAKLADAVMDAMGGSELVGEIRRNGTTIHIPYLTISDRYNQRLVIVNRGPIDAEYSMTFRPEMNVMAEGGGGHTGTVDAGETKVLVLHPMRAAQVGQDPVVMITGGSRTAASLNVVADADDIDVATVTITLETGASDTVQYFEETVHARD